MSDRHIIVYDFETYYSTVDYTLAKMSAVDYVRDPRFHALLLAISVDNGAPLVFEHDEIPAALSKLPLNSPSTVLIGHNSAGFDNLILSEVYDIHPQCILTDTMHMMRWSGLSRVCGESLRSLSEALGIGEKGTGTVMSNGKRVKSDFTPEEWAEFRAYCAQDVRLTAKAAFLLLPFMTRESILFSSITSKMATDPAFVINEPVLEAYLNELAEKEKAAKATLMEILGITDDIEFLKTIRSAKKFEALLRMLNVDVPMKLSAKQTVTRKKKLEQMLPKATGKARAELEAMLADPASYEVWVPALAKSDLEFLALEEHPDPRVRELIRLRLENNSSVPMSRTQSLLHMGAFKRPVPVLLKCFYAHTSRYGAGTSEGRSDGTNFQNLAKHNKAMLPIRQGIVCPPGHVIIACDSSQIEARCVAYEAQQMDLLEQFAQGRDPYAELAAKFEPGHTAQEIHDGAKSGNKELKLLRSAGKRAVLSCWEATAQVLTNSGWKPIVDVSLNDQLWDGEQWVQHNGLICNGEKPVITFHGTSVTPDHMIYDGTSWRTVAELASEPSYSSQAQSFATASCSMLPSEIYRSRSAQALCTSSSARIAATDTGCLRITGSECLRNTVRNVLLLLHTKCLKFSQIILSGLKWESLPFWKMGTQPVNVLQRMGLKLTKLAQLKCNVLVGANHIGLIFPICTMEEQLVAMPAQRKKQGTLSLKTITPIATYALTLNTDDGCLGESMRKLPVALTPVTGNIFAMAHGELLLVSRTVEKLFNTICLCLDGMTRRCKLIASTITKGMNLEISGSFFPWTTSITGEMSMSCKPASQNSKPRTICCGQKSQSLKLVYDINNAGPNHRYLVRTADGSIFMAHNCGYGAGAKKYADSIWRDGTHLDENKERHDELAKPLHAMYRANNPMIVMFWKVCGNVISALCAGQSGAFGGPNNDLFEYGLMPLPNGQEVPSIKMPTGYCLRYPNLSWDEETQDYRYDRLLGKNIVRTKIYGGSVTENCVAKGTQVLTDSGWKFIETINKSDLVFDGEAFVSHEGLINKGVQDCICLEGVWLTSDHEVLVDGNGRLVRPLWEDASQFQRHNRAKIWEPNSDRAASFKEWEMGLGASLFVRRDCISNDFRTNQGYETRGSLCLPTMYERNTEYCQLNTWDVQYSDFQCVAFDVAALRNPYISCISTLRWAWDNCVRVLAYVREFLQRHVTDISSWFSFRSDRQQRKLLSRKLSLDYLQRKQQEQSGSLQRSGSSNTVQTNWHQFVNSAISRETWVAAGAFIRYTESGANEQTKPASIQKEVFDIKNCGPKHRFLVRSDAGVFLCHNCTQCFAFQILMFQANLMAERGLHLHCNIHDSFATVVPESEAEKTKALMLECMRVVPSWAQGLPLDAEVEEGHDFSVV